MFLHPSWCGKAAWFRKHQYDERLRSAEDQELLLRAAASSRFASVDKILLGYRKESLGLSKSIAGRIVYSRAVWRQARQSGDYPRAAAGIALHFVKYATEVAVSGVGAEQWLLRRKYRQSPSAEETAQWRKIWNEISSPQKNYSRIRASAKRA